MTTKISTSFAEFNPEEVIERISFHLKRIEIIKKDNEIKWKDKLRVRQKSVGIWPFKRKVPWTEEEIDHVWIHGFPNKSIFEASAKYYLNGKYEFTISEFKRISDFCQLAIDQGNKAVYLSKEDALFAFNWQ
jgi:hypothetical protein